MFGRPLVTAEATILDDGILLDYITVEDNPYSPYAKFEYRVEVRPADSAPSSGNRVGGSRAPCRGLTRVTSSR